MLAYNETSVGSSGIYLPWGVGCRCIQTSWPNYVCLGKFKYVSSLQTGILTLNSSLESMKRVGCKVFRGLHLDVTANGNVKETFKCMVWDIFLDYLPRSGICAFFIQPLAWFFSLLKERDVAHILHQFLSYRPKWIQVLLF